MQERFHGLQGHTASHIQLLPWAGLTLNEALTNLHQKVTAEQAATASQEAHHQDTTKGSYC